MHTILVCITTLTFSSFQEAAGFSVGSTSITSRVNQRPSSTKSLPVVHRPLSTLSSLSSTTTSSWSSSSASSMTGVGTGYGSSQTSSSSSFSLLSPSSKFYQLEEMEDRESCTTEIFLSQDGTVTVTDTNGPPPVRSSGTWKATTTATPATPATTQSYSVNNDENDDIIQDDCIGGSFEMKITRTYSTGNDASDVGEFSFDVERTFTGDISTVGGLVSVTGSMHMMDDFFGDTEVGFFSMIDTTDAKLGAEQK